MPQDKDLSIKNLVNQVVSDHFQRAITLQRLLDLMASINFVAPFAYLRMWPLQNLFIQVFKHAVHSQNQCFSIPCGELIRESGRWTLDANLLPSVSFGFLSPQVTAVTTGASVSGCGAPCGETCVRDTWSKAERSLLTSWN